MGAESPWISILTTVVDVILGASFVLLIVGMALLAIGAIWSPFASFICNRISRANGLDTDAFTGAGFGYSALFFLPWFYLVGRMNDRIFSRSAIAVVYVLVFAIWLSLILGYIDYWRTHNYFFDSYGLERHGLGKAITVTVIWIGAAVANFAAWFFTLRALIRADRRDRRRPISNRRDILPGGIYIYPFGFLLTWLFVFGILWVITYAYISP